MKKTIFILLVSINLFTFSFLAEANDIQVKLNNRSIQFNDAEPTIINGRVLVPIRFLFDYLRVSAKFIDSSQSVEFIYNDKTYQLPVGQMKYSVDGIDIKTDCSQLLLITDYWYH